MHVGCRTSLLYGMTGASGRSTPVRLKQVPAGQVVTGDWPLQVRTGDHRIEAVVGETRLGSVGKADECATAAVFDEHHEH